MQDICAAFAVDPQGLALTDHSRAYTWLELLDRATRAGNAFDALAPNARVGVIGSNCTETLIAHLGAALNGIASVAINARLKSHEMAYILKDANVGVCVGGREIADTARVAAKDVGCSFLEWDSAPESAPHTWDALIAQASPQWHGDDRPSEPMLLYTSGTSGFPKGTRVQWSNRSGSLIRDYFGGIRDAMSSIPAGPHLVVGPLHHHGPLMSLRSLIAGRTVIIEPQFDAIKILEAIQQFKVASSVMVPTHLSRLLTVDDAVKASFDISSLQRIVLTGAMCPVSVKAGIIEWMGPIISEAYGGSESGTICMISSEEWIQRTGSVGKALPRFQVIVVDDDGREVPAGTPGRLFFKDSLGRGVEYLNDPAKTAAAHIAPAVFTIGDIGYVDHEGYVYLTDRSIDMIISGGVNIYPVEAEHVLLSHPNVDDVAVIGVHDEDFGESALALIQLRDPENQTDPSELDQICRESLASYKCPKSYMYVATLNRDQMGKLNKRALKVDYPTLILEL